MAWILLIGCIVATPLSSKVDSFYTNLFKEGKELYQQGDYNGALENFEVAEFGFQEDKGLLLELYCYSALCYSKTDRNPKAEGTLDKIVELTGESKPERIPFIPSLRGLMMDLWSEIKGGGGAEKPQKKPPVKKKAPTKTPPPVLESFDSLYQNTLKALEVSDLKLVKKNLKKLKRQNKKDHRLYYLEGVYEFKRENYKTSIKRLNKVDPDRVTPPVMDEVFFYMAYSYYNLDQMDQMLIYYQGIINPELKKLLKPLLQESTPPPKIPPTKKSPPQKTKPPEIKKPPKPITLPQNNRFNQLFNETLELINQKRFDQVGSNIVKMEKMNQSDDLVRYLKGLLAFYKGNYSDCIYQLTIINYAAVDLLVLDDIFYHLAFSHYHLTNHHKVVELYEKISHRHIKDRLTPIINKIKPQKPNPRPNNS